MEKLGTPVLVDSDLGPVQATHVRRLVQLNQAADGDRIISTQTLALETANGIKDIPGTQESVDITGDDLGSLSYSDFLSAVGAKHQEIKARMAKATADALAARAEQLAAEIAATEARLAELRNSAK
jgi:hypothetical protein